MGSNFNEAFRDTTPVPPPRGVSSSPVHPGLLRRRLAFIMLVRVILCSLILGGTVAVNLALDTPEKLAGPHITFLFVFIAILFLLNIAYAVLLRLLPGLPRQAAIQMAGDLLTAVVLVHFSAGADSPFILLFLLIPIEAAVTLGRRAAVMTAAVGTVLLAAIFVLGYAHLLPVFPGQVPPPPAYRPAR